MPEGSQCGALKSLGSRQEGRALHEWACPAEGRVPGSALSERMFAGDWARWRPDGRGGQHTVDTLHPPLSLWSFKITVNKPFTSFSFCGSRIQDQRHKRHKETTEALVLKQIKQEVKGSHWPTAVLKSRAIQSISDQNPRPVSVLQALGPAFQSMLSFP